MLKRKVFGFFLLVVGLVMILGTSPLITGNVVLEDVRGLQSVKIIGLVLFISGIVLIAVDRDGRKRKRDSKLKEMIKENKAWGEPGPRREKMIDQRHTNKIAYTACRWSYKREHGGENPTKLELRRYMRDEHITENIPYIVEEYLEAMRK
jgi:hypothetical protein